MPEYIVNSTALRHDRRTYNRGDTVELDKELADKLGDAVLTKTQFERQAQGGARQSQEGEPGEPSTPAETTSGRSKRGQ